MYWRPPALWNLLPKVSCITMAMYFISPPLKNAQAHRDGTAHSSISSAHRDGTAHSSISKSLNPTSLLGDLHSKSLSKNAVVSQRGELAVQEPWCTSLFLEARPGRMADWDPLIRPMQMLERPLPDPWSLLSSPTVFTREIPAPVASLWTWLRVRTGGRVHTHTHTKAHFLFNLPPICIA